MDQKRKSIIDYYEVCERDYRLFWDLNHSMAMHAGFWDETTKNLRDALLRENEIMAETIDIKSNDRILDAGCGVGGSSIFLAKRYGCHVTGISLSAKQVETATSAALKSGVSKLTTFQVSDFCETSFPDASFDVIWGLESICHAEDKGKFIKEAYRLLKKGGRLIVADGFALQNDLSPQDQLKMTKWLKGWGVESLETLSAFNAHLQDNHFQHIVFRDITNNVLPSSKRLYWISFPAIVYSKIGEVLGFRNKLETDNIKAAYYQYTTLKKGLWRYFLLNSIKN